MRSVFGCRGAHRPSTAAESEESVTYPEVSWDKSVNAASIVFGRSAEARRGVPVEDGDGNVVAVLRFAATGELLELELLDAETQLPAGLRT
jgi:hypothetical protein